VCIPVLESASLLSDHPEGRGGEGGRGAEVVLGRESDSDGDGGRERERVIMRERGIEARRLIVRNRGVMQCH
jgi:hypothetical protein